MGYASFEIVKGRLPSVTSITKSVAAGGVGRDKKMSEDEALAYALEKDEG